MNRIPVTIGLLTYNSEENLGRALESVKDFSEIILADGGSTDRTLEIAKQYGARVIPQSNPGHPIADFALERNRLLEAATNPWFFYLDSDEILSPELKEFFRSVSELPDHPYQAYRVRYLKTNADGTHPYRTYREYYQIRFVRTDLGARFVRPVHERLELPPGTNVGQTEAPWYVTLDAEYLSLKVFGAKAWKRTKTTANAWTPCGPVDVLTKVIAEPAVLIAKSFYKMVAVKIRWGKDAIPMRYELLRVLYSLMLSVRHAERVLRGRPLRRSL